MTKKQKKLLRRILVSALTLAVVYVVCRFFLGGDAWQPYARAGLYLIPYLTVGYDVWRRAVRTIAHGQVFDENFLMCLATVGAFVIGEYPEAAFVMLFYQTGELFQSCAVGKSRRSIASLMDIRPERACVLRNGEETVVSPADVSVDEEIVIRPGERIPLDGDVVAGEGSIDTAALTGESVPRDVGVGSTVVSGCVNLDGVLRVRVRAPYGESTVAKILDLVENSSGNKAKSEAFITRFARYYTPAVVAAALLIALLPPLLGGAWKQWLESALIFLVVSCPCALVISVPLSYFGGIGGASAHGILVKGANYFERLAAADTVVFDKTGTLTRGVFEVDVVHTSGVSERELLSIASHVEAYSDHPIAKSLRAAAGMPDPSRVRDVRTYAGEGITATIDGVSFLVGNEKMMARFGVCVTPCTCHGTVIHVARGEDYLGHITIADQVKEDAPAAVARLRASGVRRTLMLTGDDEDVAARVARTCGIDEYHASLLPDEKVAYLENALGDRHTVAFVGDGVNDAPSLARADVGIAMGALGSDAAIEAADVVLMDDDPMKIAEAIRLARRTKRIATENIAFALTVKLAVMVLSVFSLAPMWAAVFADVGVSVIAILNAMRTLRKSL